MSDAKCSLPAHGSGGEGGGGDGDGDTVAAARREDEVRAVVASEKGVDDLAALTRYGLSVYYSTNSGRRDNQRTPSNRFTRKPW